MIKTGSVSNDTRTSCKPDEVIEKCVLVGGLGSWLLSLCGGGLRFFYRVLENRFNVGVHDLHRFYSTVAKKLEQRPQPTSAKPSRSDVLSICECTSKVVGNLGVIHRVPDRSHIEGINKTSRETVHTFSEEKLRCRIKGKPRNSVLMILVRLEGGKKIYMNIPESPPDTQHEDETSFE